MKAFSNRNVSLARTLAALSGLWLASAHLCSGAQNDALPPGSFVLRGPSARSRPAVALPPPGSPLSPEHLFGVGVELAMRTNGYSVLTRAFDVDAFFRRFVPRLPVSEEIRQSLIVAHHFSDALRRDILKEAVVGVAGSRVRFLGARYLGQEAVLLFRDTDTPPVVSQAGSENAKSAAYFAYVAERQGDGSIRLVDVQRFAGGELLSETMRRRILLELARKKLLDSRLSAKDDALLTGLEASRLFEGRCGFGHFDMIKDAYEKLPGELQNDRWILYRYATSGDQTIKDVLITLDHWRKLYSGDPTPDILLVDCYWRFYPGPRSVPDSPDKGTNNSAVWSAQQEQAVSAAIQKANLWFADPALDIRLAGYYESTRPDKARLLLWQALQRFPLENQALVELLKIDLATTNYVGVADSLRRQEAAFQTNLTTYVAARPEYAEFRKSFAWKQWQRNSHNAQVKELIGTARQ